jgi:pimeloyl-ACP methyl ester carboxylesterase
MRPALDRLPEWSRRWGTAETIENLVIGGTLTAVGAKIAIRELRGPGSGMPGRVVGSGLHVVSRGGRGSPTVVFENGLGYPATTWSWIQRGLPAGIASLAYDRAGSGWSPPQNRFTGVSYTQNLFATMRSVAASAPFILVGHSVGGLLTRIFAQRYPDLVGGMVFVDSAHPAQYERSPGQIAALERLCNDLDQMIARGRVGMRPSQVSPLRGLPEDVGPATSAMAIRLRNLRVARRELDLCVREWTAQAAELIMVDPKPVAVVSAQHSIATDPVMDQLHQELTDLSQVSKRVVVPGSDHRTLLTHEPFAAQVTEAITWVIDQMAPATTEPAQQGGSQ